MSDKGKFIVVFKEGTTKEQIDGYVSQLKGSGGSVTNSYYDSEHSILNGFAAEIPQSFLSSLQQESVIDYIEPDGVVTTQ